mgnify:CR=1 FL=1
MGPWRPTSDGNLIGNPYAWSKMANMVFLEQPIGVGYSYDSNEPEPNTDTDTDTDNGVRGDIPFGDYHAVSDMIAAMVVFFEKYPDRLHNKVYIASESYGGHYIPELTLGLLNKLVPISIKAMKPTPKPVIGSSSSNIIGTGNDDDDDSVYYAEMSRYNNTLGVLQGLHDRFSGYIVGNPYVSFASGEIAGALTAWGYQILPKSLWERFKGNDCHLLISDVYRYSNICWNLLYEIDTQIMIGGGLVNGVTNSSSSNSSRVANSALIDHGLNICKSTYEVCV